MNHGGGPSAEEILAAIDAHGCGPPLMCLLDDGPVCPFCGCSEHNPCAVEPCGLVEEGCCSNCYNALVATFDFGDRVEPVSDGEPDP